MMIERKLKSARRERHTWNNANRAIELVSGSCAAALQYVVVCWASAAQALTSAPEEQRSQARSTSVGSEKLVLWGSATSYRLL